MTIGTTEILIVLLIVLILFGPSRLPDLARAVGKSIRAYKEELEKAKPAKKKRQG